MKTSAQFDPSLCCENNERDEKMRAYSSVLDVIDAKASIPALFSELAFGSKPSGPTAAALSNAFAMRAFPRRPILR